MSTYLYLECWDHHPPLRAEDESGQHLHDIPTILQDVANRNWLVGLWDEGKLDDYDGSDTSPYFVTHTAHFLSQHRDCNVGIVDEYGVRYDGDGNKLSPGSTVGKTTITLPAGTPHSTTHQILADIGKYFPGAVFSLLEDGYEAISAGEDN